MSFMWLGQLPLSPIRWNLISSYSLGQPQWDTLLNTMFCIGAYFLPFPRRIFLMRLMLCFGDGAVNSRVHVAGAEKPGVVGTDAAG